MWGKMMQVVNAESKGKAGPQKWEAVHMGNLQIAHWITPCHQDLMLDS